MLTLVLMRHGQASFDASDDFSRRLSNVGRAQVLSVAQCLLAQDVKPDLIISSDAPRALSSADILTSVLCPTRRLSSHLLYSEHTTQQFLDLISSSSVLSDKCVAVVAHNPDISYRAIRLSKSFSAVSFPTAGVVVLSFDAVSWSDVQPASADLLWCSF